MSNFKDKVVIVTGGGTGIGRAIAETFAESQAKVLIAGRRESPLQELSERYPGKVSLLLADVTKAQDRKKIIQTAIDRYGRLDVLVNSAGIHLVARLEESTDEQFEQSYLTNLIAPASLIREAIPHLSESNGSVINISTIGARAIFPEISPYTCSKTALDHLTKVSAVELGPLGIRVNGVAPGMTRTDMAAPYITDEMAAMTPLGRIGEPVDVARLVLFLASEDAGWVTGQIVDASGGLKL